MILLNDFKRQWEDTAAEVLAAVAAVGESGWYVLGKHVANFEQAFATVWGRRYAAGVGSGLDALEISLRVLGCKAGDRVLTSPLSAFATTLAILKIGGVPVFVDTDRTGHIDLRLCREVLEKRPEIRYFIPVHLYGNVLDMRALAALRADFDLRVVEDCAQSVLAKPSGLVGQLAATSFYPTKNLGALGDGGAILCDDAEFDRQVRVLRDYGQSAKYRHDEIGYNSRLDEVQAAILDRVYLPALEKWTKRRREIAAQYREGIAHGSLELLAAPSQAEGVHHLFPVLVKEGKTEFLAYMRQRGILCGEHYPIAIPDQGALAEWGWEAATGLEEARRIAKSEVSLPIHPYLSDGEVDLVMRACREWPGV